MKIMVCGKGGSGKTSLTVLMAKILSKEFNVYIVDSDESNILLPNLLGVRPPKTLVEYVGGKRDEEVFERAKPEIIQTLSRAKGGIRLDLLPEEYVATSSDGVKLVTIGKVREYGEDCACPFNILAKILLGNLLLKEDEVVLVDTDAGIEHVGRRLEEVSDGLIVIIDPTAESMELALMLKKVAQSLKKKFWVIANKVTEDIRELLMEKAAEINLEIDGVVRFDRELYFSCLKKEELRSNIAILDLKEILEKTILAELVGKLAGRKSFP
ncbi:MAG: ATP-binding protein [Candidatus Bathyarchaeota archaeon]|nr:ATP-binding protein [Candidatus Bathyarchaeota archaeon]